MAQTASSILEGFREYLLYERCLCESTSTLYCRCVSAFLNSLPDRRVYTSFTEREVKHFLDQKLRISGTTAYVTQSILTMFSKYLFLEGWRDSCLRIYYRPKYQPAKKATSLLRGCLH